MDRLVSRVGRGALHGIEIFLWYAVAEYVWLAVSLLVRSHRVMLIEQVRGTVVLLAAYIVIGAVAGMIVELVFGGSDQDSFRVRKVLVLTVLVLFALNCAFALLSWENRLALIAAALLIATGVFFDLGIKNGRTLPPALIFGVLTCSGWMLYSSRIGWLPPQIRVPALLCGVAAVFAAAVLANRIMSWSTGHYEWASGVWRSLRVSALLLLALGPVIVSTHAEGKLPAWPRLRPVVGAPPNIVLVTLDTVNAEHMGIHGYQRANTPHLSELLQHATLYSNFIAASPLTLSSHASIFTGLYPQSHGAYMDFDRFSNGRPLAQNIPTVAEVLNKSGYHTMAVAANKIYLSDDFGTLRGFQFVDWLSPATLVSSQRDYLLRNRLRGLLLFDRVRRDLDSIAMTAEEVNERAAGLLEQSSRQRTPFFLFLNYMDAHEPYLPPAPYSRMYPGVDLGFDLVHYYRETDEVLSGKRDIDPKARQHLVSQYDGAIAYLDEKMGELIACLKRDGEYDNTLIIITSDHGQAFGEKRIIGHNSSVYQDQVHIPLIVKYPGQTQPSRVDSLATHVDLMPTILDVAGLKAGVELQGVDLRQVASVQDRVVVAEMHGSAGNNLPRFQQIEWALYSGFYKMIYSTKGMRELYDLQTDPFELHNLFPTNAQQIAQMRTRLVDWSRKTPPRFLDPEMANGAVEERLKSLGYAHQGVE